MDEKRIEEIVQEVFKKAKKKHASHSRFALSNHISEQSDLSSKTLERAYERYIEKNGKHGAPNAESINLFCKYLDYEDYGSYLEKNSEDEFIEELPKGGGNKWRLIITICIALGAILVTALIFQNQTFTEDTYSSENNKTTDNTFNTDIDKNNCMTWADSTYIAISCETGPFSKYGTQVKPLDPMELKSMRKVEVDASYQFFSDTDQPLIWYYKNKDGDHEYFTAPGFHPTTGETLRKITPYIIQAYVPIHSDLKVSDIPKV